jgi:hypothetical protein
MFILVMGSVSREKSRKNILYEVCKKNDGGMVRRNYFLFLLNITSGMLGDINEFF